jgi:hypothetical protein
MKPEGNLYLKRVYVFHGLNLGNEVRKLGNG